jgi:hypothetical protein
VLKSNFSVKRPTAAGGIRLLQPSFGGLLCTVFFMISLPICTQSVESTLARSGYSEEHKDAIIAFFVEMEDSDIPAELLLPKLEEGFAKSVSAPRVLLVLRREAGNLQRTRGLMLRSETGRRLLADPASWARTANLLAVGVSEVEIEELIALCKRRNEGFRPVTYLYVAVREWGIGRGTAFDLLRALVESPIPPDSYMGVLDLLANGRRRRIPPEELVQRIQQNLERTNSIKELERWIY